MILNRCIRILIEEQGTFSIFSCNRNCLIGQGYAVKISDFAMFRPAYSSDYFKTTENVKDIPTANASNQGDVIPLRWIPWEVYIMVRVNITKILKNRNIFYFSL